MDHHEEPTGQEEIKPPLTTQPSSTDLPLPVGWLDPDVLKVLRRLQGRGFTTYLVGGCVRDLLVGRYPKDFDVATAALPQQVRDTFGNCRLIGRRFRLAHVMFRDHIVEVATFRKAPSPSSPEDVEADMELEDDEAALEGGEEVHTPQRDADLLIREDNEFGTPIEDAFRRDFTINGLYYDTVRGEVLDFVGGMDDIEARLVRTVGIPERRFREDPVRMIRAIKFSASLGFPIEDKTWMALVESSGEIRRAAPPRIQEEMFRMLRGGYAERSLRLMSEGGLLSHVLPLVDTQLRAEVAGEGLGEDPPTAGVLGWLSAVEMIDQSRAPLPNHILIVAMIATLAWRRVDLTLPIPVGQAWFQHCDDVLHEISGPMRVSRRDRELARLALLGFTRMMFPGKKKGFLSSLVRRSYFPDTLVLFMLHILAGDGDPTEALQLFQRVTRTPVLDAMLRALERRSGISSSAVRIPPEQRPVAAKPKRRRRRRRPDGENRGGDSGPVTQ